MSQSEKITLTIVGAGRVGQTLGRLFVESGLVDLKYVIDRELTIAKKAVDFVGAGQPLNSFTTNEVTELYFLAVSDEQIESVAKELSQFYDLSHSIVFHASGALFSDVLKKTMASVASIHPLRSFASPELSVLDFEGTYCGVEGDVLALETLEPLFSRIGGKCFSIDSSQKVLYHAGAVFASNFIPLLIESSIQCYLKAGISKEVAMDLVAPLMHGMIDNVLKMGVKGAMTGPVVRGDNEVTTAHQAKLATSLPDQARLYQSLTSELSKLVK